MSTLEFFERLAHIASNKDMISRLIDDQPEIIKKAFANNDVDLLISIISPDNLQQANHAFIIHI